MFKDIFKQKPIHDLESGDNRLNLLLCVANKLWDFFRNDIKMQYTDDNLEFKVNWSDVLKVCCIFFGTKEAWDQSNDSTS